MGSSRGPGDQLGNSGFSPGSQNLVQLDQPPSSLDRTSAVTNHPWPGLLNLATVPTPPGDSRTPGQEEQTPRLSLDLNSPPPGQQAGLVSAPSVLCGCLSPLPGACPRPHTFTQVFLCAITHRPLSWLLAPANVCQGSRGGSFFAKLDGGGVGGCGSESSGGSTGPGTPGSGQKIGRGNSPNLALPDGLGGLGFQIPSRTAPVPSFLPSAQGPNAEPP